MPRTARSAPRMHFALIDPALAVAPVFLSLPTRDRGILDVRQTFAGKQVHWHGPHRLDIADQSMLFTLLCLAPQRLVCVDPQSPCEAGRKLVERLHLMAPNHGMRLAALETTWKEVILAKGYSDTGGRSPVLARASLERLASVTVHETPAIETPWRSGGPVNEEPNSGKAGTASRLLSWSEAKDGRLFVLFNPRSTAALPGVGGGQHIRISLAERGDLSNTVARALHAWLSATLRRGAAKTYFLDSLHKHVWAGDVTGAARRTRTHRLREALKDIDRLPGWRTTPTEDGKVEVKRDK